MSTLTPLPHGSFWNLRLQHPALDHQAPMTAVNSSLLSHCPLCRAAAVPVPFSRPFCARKMKTFVSSSHRYCGTPPREPEAKVCPGSVPSWQSCDWVLLGTPGYPRSPQGQFWDRSSYRCWKPRMLQLTESSGCPAHTALCPFPVPQCSPSRK